MLISYKLTQTGIILRVKLRKYSTGLGFTGLTSASTGLIIATIASNEETATAYTVAGGTIETITTIGTYTAPTATKCRFKEVDATNHKGVYEIQIADARFAVANAKHILVSVSGVADLDECDAIITLVLLDPYNATPDANVTKWLGTAPATLSGGTLVQASVGELQGGLDLTNTMKSSVTTAATAATPTAAAVTGAVGSVTAAVEATKVGGGEIGGQTELDEVLDDTEVSLPNQFNFINSRLNFLMSPGTLVGDTGNDTTHVHLDSQTFDDDELIDRLLVIYDASEAEYHSRWITDWVLSTELATVDALPFTADFDSGDTYVVLPIRRPVDPNNAGIAAIIADTEDLQTQIGTAGAGLTALGDTRIVNLDATVSSRLSTAGYTAPDNAGILTAIGGVPTNAELETALESVKLSADGLDAVLIESGITPSSILVNDNGDQLTAINARQAIAVALSQLVGLLSGANGSSPAFKPAAKPADAARIAATTATTGRTAVTLRVPD